MSMPSETVLMHLYRGELGRVAVYRVRLDNTTNWAIGVTVAVITFVLGNHEAPPSLLLLPYALGVVFMFIEARRFRELELYRSRVRILESVWVAPSLASPEAPRPEDWARELAASLAEPQWRVPLSDAVANRVRRNYIWLLLAVYCAWWVKLSLVDPRIVPAAAMGVVPGALVMAASLLLVAPFVVLALRPTRFPPG